MYSTKNILLFLFCFLNTFLSFSQDLPVYADSLRKTYHIPELGYAVVSRDSVLDMHIMGFTTQAGGRPARIDDRFRIGSNTKSVTALIAAQLVARGQLSWSTKFFHLFPEMRNGSNKAYKDITLQQLLSFRAGLPKYTYTDSLPTKGQIKGNTRQQQRYSFAQWVLQQPTAKTQVSFSNPGYVLAGMMMEKATGMTYEQLVKELGMQLDISFGFGAPNVADSMQPWGYDAELIPEAPADNYKLNWLMQAGNLNVSLPGYTRFVRMQLAGLQGKSTLLPKADFELMHYGFPQFAMGWFWSEEEGYKISYHTGNPGTFLSYVYIDATRDRAFILFANAQCDGAGTLFDQLADAIKTRYIR